MKAGKVVPFIGAGISMGVNLLLDEKSNNKRGRMPSYRELFFLTPTHAATKREALSLIEGGDLMKAADELEKSRISGHSDL